MTTGASPISGEVLDFLRICFGSEVIEGYGMTETSCTISMTSPTDLKAGHVGGPLPSCEVKLADIPEMSYTTADQPHPRGEVQSAQQRLMVGGSEGWWVACGALGRCSKESCCIVFMDVTSTPRCQLAAHACSVPLADLRAWANCIPGLLQGRGADT